MSSPDRIRKAASHSVVTELSEGFAKGFSKGTHVVRYTALVPISKLAYTERLSFRNIWKS